MFLVSCVTACLWLAAARSSPADKVLAPHIIKTRSIDLNSAHALAMEGRLGTDVEPTLYKLDLEPYLEDAVFKGHVSIDIRFREKTDEITLHCAHELNITHAELTTYNVSNLDVWETMTLKRISFDPKKPLATFHLDKAFEKSIEGKLEIDFNGQMETTSTEAFFKTTYTTDQDVERIVAGTQLRPNNARRVFPCFDEPGYRVSIELSVVRPRNMVALSNMPISLVTNITGEPDAVKVLFNPTYPMPTYALGFVIADLAPLPNANRYVDTIGNDVDLQAWARPEYHEALEGLNDKLATVFGDLAVYFHQMYPVQYMDVVVLPNYRGVKPADNWGLVVFKESDFSNGKYTYKLAQELVYQWIGTWTSPATWADAHINKALAGFLAIEIAFTIYNGNQMEGKWPMTALYSLYYEFSKRYPHSRITGMKQETACTKLELLFRMISYLYSKRTFRDGMRLFIKERASKSFTSDDIWNALNTIGLSEAKVPRGLHIKAVADSWIEKDRLPLVTAVRDYDRNSVFISQKVYLRERPHDVPGADNMTWIIPLIVARGDQLRFFDPNIHPSDPLAWLNKKKDITLEGMPSMEYFIIINPEEIGPFPVNYDQHNWYLLSKYLQSKDRLLIPELTRAKLLHDAWNLAYAGELSFDIALNMTLFLKEERHPVVWDPVFTMIDHIGRHICQSMRQKFNAYVRTLLRPLYDDLIKEEENMRKSLYGMTELFLCQAGYKPCIREAQQHYGEWVQAKFPDEGNPISNQYICPVFKYGTQKEWEFGLDRVINFPHSRKQSERTYLLKTLAGCPVDATKITRLLNITMLESNGNFTETDLFLILSMLTGSAEGYTALFHFLDKNWDVLKEKYFNKTNLWDSLVTAATSHFKTQSGLELVAAMHAARRGQFGSAEHIVDKALRNIREEARWSDENLPAIDAWLDAFLAHSNVKDDKHV